MTDRIFRYCLLVLALAAAVLVGMGRYSDVDTQLSDWMYDLSASRFPWRDSWFASVLMHRWLKSALFCFGLALAAALVADRVFSLNRLGAGMRWRLKFVVACCALVPLTTTFLKRFSIHACPWNLERYGGSAPYLRIFDALPAGAQAGHCFPAGHASSGLWLAAFAVFWLPARPKMAALVFAAGLSAGLAMGWIQQLRGAHFLTHTLWSAWIASFVMLVLGRWMYPPCEATERMLRVADFQ